VQAGTVKRGGQEPCRCSRCRCVGVCVCAVRCVREPEKGKGRSWRADGGRRVGCQLCQDMPTFSLRGKCVESPATVHAEAWQCGERWKTGMTIDILFLHFYLSILIISFLLNFEDVPFCCGAVSPPLSPLLFQIALSRASTSPFGRSQLVHRLPSCSATLCQPPTLFALHPAQAKHNFSARTTVLRICCAQSARAVLEALWFLGFVSPMQEQRTC